MESSRGAHEEDLLREMLSRVLFMVLTQVSGHGEHEIYCQYKELQQIACFQAQGLCNHHIHAKRQLDRQIDHAG